ncbi:unnamed protein product [Adineta steineri]|uniref:Uncharacterized protein n=1 Tax=Adineta steineri TaxID=433720 RepID=A0A815F0P9_9BILA|nr:unnamed protein product [Adineta steineri]CAF1583960.1 unnamed protein product [Adineta steineri]
MAALYELEDPSAKKNAHLKSIRLIELSDHLIRLNRRENTQLDLRLQQIKRRERIIKAHYDKDIHRRRLQLAQIYKTLDEPSHLPIENTRIQTPVSVYAIKMSRNQSAPPNINRKDVENKTNLRPNTTPSTIRYSKRAMSIFKEITLKPPYKTLDNMLLLINNEKKYYPNDWLMRSKTMVNIKKEN